MLRRSLVTAALTGPAALLAACSLTTHNGVTTLAVDTAKVHTDGSAIIAAIGTIIAMPPVAALLGPNLPIAQAALDGAQLALSQFDATTGGTATLSVDTTKATALVHSLISNAQNVLSVVQPILPVLPAAVSERVGSYVGAILTLIPFVQAAVDLTSAAKAKAMRLPMGEAQALQIALH
jgi:hypothetical protein